MKIRFLLFFLAISLTSCSQSNQYVGEYVSNNNSSGIKQRYRLTLNLNGTFEFEQYWAQIGMNSETQATGIEKGKGTWTIKSKLIMLSCNSMTDITQDYRLDFDDTKVSILNDSIVRFVDSKMFWVVNMELKKRI
ncbi:hypothetical protein EZV76_12785 [Flagellimonas alvinocaridis]|uniref:Lipocalin-like domain-containing protein n=1 Tax=Flagellimonas alvinocaridis TaxID=2530200 RepID=A0A4S8RIV2_9FLAO|nr:hypothetical protein [Allomuricauda alvinocaridis]THV58337.1 hypothetical protein EZV76_12785 [Allomuricauda alvinocaridis]